MGFSGLNWVAIAFLRSRSTSSYKFSTFFCWLSYGTSRSHNANYIWRLFKFNKGDRV